jgi:hypothetical protein
MTGASGLHDSLSSMGFLELGLAFVALVSYCLLLNGSLRGRARVICGALAVIAAGLLVVLTDPWMNGMILVAAGVATIGLFVAIAWGVSVACGFPVLRAPAAEVEPEAPFTLPSELPPEPAAVSRRPSSPAHST